MNEQNQDSETGCCPRFEPAPWNEKEITWQDKLFIKDRLKSIFHIPIGFDKLMQRNMEKISSSGALAPQPLMFTGENSLWGADVYIAVGKEVPGAHIEKMSGTFLSKVFEGPYRDAGKWAKEMETYVRSKGKEPEKLFFYYTTCPKCAKYYGKNYTVLLAKIKK